MALFAACLLLISVFGVCCWFVSDGGLGLLVYGGGLGGFGWWLLMIWCGSLGWFG